MAIIADWQGETLYILRHPRGSEAHIVPALGANCINLVLNGTQVIEPPTDPESQRKKPARAGIPLLFPYPGRINDATYSFEGTTYHLPRTESKGVHSIHGFVMRHAWEVEEGSSDTSLTCIITNAALATEERDGYPFGFRMHVTFDLSAHALTLRVAVENTGTGNLPFGFGTHPYLLAATDADARKANVVRVPVGAQWESNDGIPTGQTLPLTAETDVTSNAPLGERHFDTFYTSATDGGSASVYNPTTQSGVRIEADANYHTWVIFTPPQRPSIAIEPYTCVPDAFNLAAARDDTGLIILPSGRSWRSELHISLI